MKTVIASTIILLLLLVACSPGATDSTLTPSASATSVTILSEATIVRTEVVVTTTRVADGTPDVATVPATSVTLEVVTPTSQVADTTPEVAVGQATVVVATSGSGSVSVPLTSIPPNATSPPQPTPVPPTPIPTLSSGLSPTVLKYRILDEFPSMFYCDPDYYPIQQGDEMALALQRFPELQANQEEFQAILEHSGLSGLSTFSDEQKLLIYREHKRLAAVRFEPSGDVYLFELQIEESPGQGSFIKGFIDGSGAITVQERQAIYLDCPICLAAQTVIDTPDGQVPVEALREGDAVWTVDSTGARVAATLIRTGSAFVPADHQMVHVVLSDGRELWASPGHPTADGRVMADLKTGDLLDGSKIAFLEQVTYDQPATYDVLPSGATGLYWANGILMGSTLFQGQTG